MFEIQSPETWHIRKRIVSTFEQMQVPIWTGPGVYRIKRPLLEIIYGNLLEFGNKIQVGYMAEFGNKVRI